MSWGLLFKSHPMPEGRSPFDQETADATPGNATREAKRMVCKWLDLITSRGTGFGDNTGRRVKFTEISVNQMPNEPERSEGKVVAEIAVTEDMTNAAKDLHGACAMYLIDVLSTLSITALDSHEGGSGDGGVSQAIHTVFHAPAKLGDNLKIVSTSLTKGGRTMTCRCEIWNTTHHRLVASAVQVKMQPSRKSRM